MPRMHAVVKQLATSRNLQIMQRGVVINEKSKIRGPYRIRVVQQHVDD